MRARAALALLATLPVCACAPKPEAAAPSPLALDCAMPFDAQSVRITAQPRLVPAAHAPGDPAILMQQASGGQVKTTGCPYGDPKGYKQLMAYLDSLKTWTRR